MMNEYEEFAIGNFLSEWNSEASYNDIIAFMKSPESHTAEDEDRLEIGVWYPFESDSMEYVAELIENMKESVERRFVPKENPA